MTKKLEETFSLPSIDDFEPDGIMKSEEEILEETTEIITALGAAEKIDSALATVSGLNEHDNDMDDVAKRAIQSYEDLCDLGLNVHDSHAGRIYEVAATMLKTALDAKDAKVTRKLKTIELQLKKAKLDQERVLKTGGINNVSNDEFDRNELLAYMKKEIKGNTDV